MANKQYSKAYEAKTEAKVEAKTETKVEAKTNAKTKSETVCGMGVVVNCDKLRVRSEPNANKDNCITTINKGTKVEINPTLSTNEFYSVTVGDFNGYCMKEFITAK